MNVKIQGGGGGTYANTGSCTGVVTYLQHEDLERIRQGQQAEPFFNQYRDFVSPKEVTYKIDHNRAQLHKTDAKFFVITVSPSEKELAAMGASPEEQARAMKEYIRKVTFGKRSRKRPVRLGNGRFRYPRMKTRLLSAILFGAYSSQGRQDRESPRVSQCPCSLSSSARDLPGSCTISSSRLLTMI